MAFDSRIRNPLAPQGDSRVSVPQAEKKTLPGVPDSVSGLCRVTATVRKHTGCFFTRGRSRTSVPESGPDSLSAQSGGASLSQRSDRRSKAEVLRGERRRVLRAAQGSELGRSTRVYARAARLGSSRGDAANILRGQRRRRREHRRQRAFRPPNRDARTATIRPPFATAARPLPHTHRHRAHAHTAPIPPPLRSPQSTFPTSPPRFPQPSPPPTAITWFVTPVPRSGFPCALGSTDSCSTTVHMKPFSASVLQDPSGVFATTTKICTDGGSRQARAHNPSTLTVATPLLLGASAAEDQGPPPNLCRPRARYRHRAIAPPILRASCFGR